MSLNPRVTHTFEQFGALLRELASALGQYRKELEQQGVPQAEAWALTQKMEERLTRPMFDIVAGDDQGSQE